MTEETTEPAAEEDFAAMLEAFSPGAAREPKVGDRVKGRVVSIGKESVFVDTGMKIDAVVELAELVDAEGRPTVAEGDELELYIAALGENEIRLSRALSGAGGVAMLREAHQKGVPVEGRIRELCKGGFAVEIAGRRAFCPASQIDIAPVPDPAVHLGQTYQFLISRLEDRGRNIVVSRRTLLSRELEASRRQFLESLAVGDVLDGTVARVVPFGAFVTIFPGLEGMVHISEMSWSRTGAAEELLKPGERVRVKVIAIERGEGPKPAKIALSIKQLEEDPWLTVEERFKAGDAVRGKVTRCLNFGAFVEIAPGIEGLIHISELSYTRRVTKCEEVVNPGDLVTAVIKSVEADKKRIALSLRDAEGDPWAEVLERFPTGQHCQGVVEKKEKFGWFVRLAPGVTGLLPLSVIRRSSAAAEIERAREGDTVNVVVEEVNLQRRRISLAPASAGDEGEWQRFSPSPRASLGSMAEKLQQALRSKQRQA